MDFDTLTKKKKIELVGKDLRDIDLDVLVEVLQKSDKLEELNLMINQISLSDDNDNNAFADALAQNHTLKTLNLYNNSIGPDGARRLADALEVNTTIETLNLEGNEIGDEGIKHLASALKRNSSIAVLILRGNQIGNAGASSLASALLFNTGVRVVLLGENRIGTDGAQSLCEALEFNASVDQVLLDTNNISNIMELKVRNVLSKPSRKNPKNGVSVLPKEVVVNLLAAKEREMDAKDDELEAAQGEIAHRDAVLKSKDEEIALLKQLEDVVHKKEEEIGAKNRKIERRDEALTAKAKEIARRDRKLASKDKEIAALKKTLGSPLEVLAKFVQTKDKEIKSLQYALAEAIASSSQDADGSDSDDDDDDATSDDEEEEEDRENENKDPTSAANDANGKGSREGKSVGVLRSKTAVGNERNMRGTPKAVVAAKVTAKTTKVAAAHGTEVPEEGTGAVAIE